MSNDVETMLVAGEGGGKSTFTGGLIHYLYRNDNKSQGTYRFEYGDESEFNNKILDRMENRLYPKQTDFPYLIEIRLDHKREMQAVTPITIMDIPGEEQEGYINSLIDRTDWNPAEIREKYLEGNNPVQDSIKDEEALTKSQWKTVYLYRYLRSDKAIFIFNLHKYMEEVRTTGTDTGAKMVVKPEHLEKAAEEKRRAALLITALDKARYEPDNKSSIFGGAGFSLSPSTNDRKMYDHLTSNLKRRDYRQLHELLDRAYDHDRIDLMGVSIPKESNTGGLIEDSNGFETHGFDRVISWLKK